MRDCPVTSGVQAQLSSPPLHLDANEGGWVHPVAVQSLRGTTAERLRRYPCARDLERDLASSWGLATDQVVVTAGADDAIDRVCRCWLAGGKELVVATPTFEMYERFAQLAGGVIRSVPWEVEFPMEELLASVGPNTGAIVIISPNNPTGEVLEPEVFERICANFDGTIVLDAAYAEFAAADLTPIALRYPQALVLRTFSKALGLAGLRVGYAMGSAARIAQLRANGLPYPVAQPALDAARAVLRGRGDFHAAVTRVCDERERLQRLLRSRGLEPTQSQANFVFLRSPRVPFFERALQLARISTRTWPRLEGALRISCPGSSAAFDRLESALEQVLRPECLLFDLDGVLVDVRGSYRRAIQQTAATYGVELLGRDIDMAKQQPGASDDWSVTQRLLSEHGVSLSLSEVTDRFRALYMGTASHAGLESFERLLISEEQLSEWSNRWPMGIVTARPRDELELAVARFGLERFFRVLVSRDDAPCKPDPAPVRLAMERLGARRGWFVGDSPDDIIAARAAGQLAIGVGDTELQGHGAAIVLEQVGQLEEVLPCS